MEGLNKISIRTNVDKLQVGDYLVTIRDTSKIGGTHHPNKQFIIAPKNSTTGFTFTTMSSPCGCGSILLYGTTINSDILTDDLITIVLKIFELFKSDGAGCFNTMLGDRYYKLPIYQAFEKLGFKVLSEYYNYRHSSSNGTQRLLQLIL